MKQCIGLILLILASLVEAKAQYNDSLTQGYLLHGKVVEGDTVPFIDLPEVVIVPPMVFTSPKQQQQYDRLTRYVKKVYPYSVMVRELMNQIEDTLAKIPTERERKKYIKTKEKELFDRFEDELKQLTIMQGRILIKLVDRQTGRTTYEVVKELKGNVSAFFWQSLASMFGSSLKAEYDADGDDAMIEDIILRIENGQL